MEKRSSVEIRKRFDFRVIIATICFAIGTFCFLNYHHLASAQEYEIFTKLTIQNIELSSDVTKTHLLNYKIVTPDYIVGSFSRAENKTLLVGHSTTAFENLKNVELNDEIEYNDKKYVTKKIEVLEKADIDMDKILAPAKEDTLVLMTCAGELYDNGDASHRLIITAELV
ncbi:sortase [Candidatus Saccharibacteria bacterium]|nr:sortase [Candidatus Saccharibacteria bacterium]